MSQQDKFLRKQKILRISTVDKNKVPHIVPVWYMYNSKKIYIGTNTNTKKAKNIKQNKNVAFCVDVGVNSPDIYGILGQGKANLILDNSKVKRIAKKILLRYFKSMNESAQELLDDTDCIIEIIPEKITTWDY